MRILGFMIVRDEADIIETTIRHNLVLLDELRVVDHGSTDGTSEILAALAAEGLPLRVTNDANPRFRQTAMTNSLVRQTLWGTPVDWIVPIDADEFLAAHDRADLERTLGGFPRDRPSLLAWPTCIPSFDAQVPLVERLAHPRRVTDPGHAFRKVVVPRAVLELRGVEIDNGNHGLAASVPGTTVPAGFPVPREQLAMIHVPIRSADQFLVKCATGWLSVVAQERRRPSYSFHWRDAFDAIVAGVSVDDAMLTAAAVNYGIPRAAWRDVAGLVEDAPPFLLASEVRYAHLARPSGIGRVLKHAERLLTAPR